MGEERLIAIGKVLGTQGNRGEVRVFPLTDFPERFEGLEAVKLKQGELVRDFRLEGSWLHGRLVVIKFQGVESIGEAEKLKDAELVLPESQLVPLPEGRYYLFELVGLEVFTTEGAPLGKLEEVLVTGSNDVYRVVRPVGGQEVLIPALKSVVKEIDRRGGRMVVELPPGLLE